MGNVLREGARVGALGGLCLSFVTPLLSAQSEPPSDKPFWELPGSWNRLGDTNSRSLGDWDIGFGIQYRLMYNASNIPGPGGSTFEDTQGYDFSRQRLRFNLDLAPKGGSVGAFTQFEFRGGSGGTGPGFTDPRAVEPRLNPFNFIEFRGLRYGYLYWDVEPDHRLMAGLVPVSDEFGDTLFSADWDWIVAGVSYLGATEDSRFRAAAVNLVEGVGSPDGTTVDNDGSLLIFDYDQVAPEVTSGWGVGWGMHLYALLVEENLPLGGTEEVWLGPSFKATKDDFELEGFAILNAGDLGTGVLDADGTVISGFGDEDAESHVGHALKLAARKQVGAVDVRAQVISTSGDPDGEFDERFVTPQGLFGASGYWGYTHILSANGPSDVNDLGLEIGNDGAGLFTAQALLSTPLNEHVDLNLAGGFFRAAEERNGSRDMGYEVVLGTSARLGGPLVLDAGVAMADLDEFFGADPDTLYEVFVRLQLQY